MRTIHLPAEESSHPIFVLLDPLLRGADPDLLLDFSRPRHRGIVKGPPSFVLAHSIPATEPPHKTIRITSPHFRGSIQLSVYETNFVSVMDVLSGIHHYLNRPVGEGTITVHQMNQAEAQFHQRCDRIAEPQARAAEVRAGIKLVDLLGGVHCFASLAWVEGNVLRLRLRR